MTVALAEQPTFQLQHEKYAASLRTLRKLGEIGLSGESVAGVEAVAFDDFTTRVGEMLKTDTELRGRLDVNREKLFSYSDGKVRAEDGTPMVEIVHNGFVASQTSADARLRETQAVRDEGDVMVAEMVDELGVGQSLIVISMDPKNDLRGPDAEFWRRHGYREGIAYIQWYCRSENDQMWASAISVDRSDLQSLRDVMVARGVDIPEDIDPNTFIRYAYTFEAGVEETKQEALAMRRECYEVSGIDAERLSVDEYLSANQSLLAATFTSYYPVIARALVSGRNQVVLQEFAATALGKLEVGSLDAAVRRQLIRLAASDKFDDSMARALDEIIPYSVVEQLRRGLINRFEKPQLSTQTLAMAGIEHYQLMRMQDLHQATLAGLQRGLAAGRSYGGCSGVNLATKSDSELEQLNQQDTFGGAKEGKDFPTGEDQYGALTFKCTEGHTNHRQRGKLLSECQTKPCKKGSVGCK